MPQQTPKKRQEITIFQMQKSIERLPVIIQYSELTKTKEYYAKLAEEYGLIKKLRSGWYLKRTEQSLEEQLQMQYWEIVSTVLTKAFGDDWYISGEVARSVVNNGGTEGICPSRIDIRVLKFGSGKVKIIDIDAMRVSAILLPDIHMSKKKLLKKFFEHSNCRFLNYNLIAE